MTGVRELQLKYKGNRCAHCGLSVVESLERFGTFHRMYHFNHVDPSKKADDYENLIRRNITTEQLDELDKCVLLCAQCHAVVHAQDINITPTMTVTTGGRTASQTFKGQVIFDKVANKISFFSDDELLIMPYILTIGDEEPRVVFGHEVKECLLDQWVLRTKGSGPLALLDFKTHELLFGAIQTSDTEFEAEILYKLSLLPVHAQGNEGTVWMRNGLAIIKIGNQIAMYEAGVITMTMFYAQAKAS